MRRTAPRKKSVRVVVTAAPHPPMPDFIEPQLCNPADTPPLDDERRSWGHEVKWDGYRIQLRVERGVATLRSRSNLDWTRKLAPIAKAAKVLPDCFLDGEVIALDGDNQPSFHVLQSISERLMRPPLRYCGFDILILKGQDLRTLPYVERKEILGNLLRRYPQVEELFFVEWFPATANLFAKACAAQMEGTISKRLDAPYRSGRSSAWVKVKCRRTRRKQTNTLST